MAVVVKNGNGSSWMMPVSIMAGVVIALLQAFWGVAYSGLISNQTRIEDQASRRLLQVEKDFLRTREHEEFAKRLDAQIRKDEDRLESLATRNEVDARLLTNSTAISQMRAELAEFKRDFGQTYSVKDALVQIQLRLERLETWSKPKSAQ